MSTIDPRPLTRATPSAARPEGERRVCTPLAPRRAGRARRRREGAAYLEAVLVLPTLILLFALVMFVREGYSRAGVSAADTRTHGWVNVMTSCTSDSVPSPTALREEGGWSISRIGTLAVVLIRLMGIVDDQPLLLLTENARTIGSFEIGERRFSQSLTMDRPDALGGEARYGHQIVLMCDEDTEKLEMPGFGFSLWSFVMWNEFAWQRADL